MYENRKKILFIVNTDWFFVSHRLPIALAAIDNGYEVHLATKITTKAKFLTSQGLYLHDLPIARSSPNPFRLANAFFFMFVLINSIKPDIIHAITIKPVLLAGFISRFYPKINFVASISGLGYVFISKGNIAKLRLILVKLLYTFSFTKTNLKVIFQNQEDINMIKSFCKLKDSKVILIPGSGIDLQEYSFSNIPAGKPIVLFASRLLVSKGILEFIKASMLVDSSRFLVAGKIDQENPDSIDMQTIRDWEVSGFGEYCGFEINIQKLISKSTMVVLPSFYGEGLPKILIEAAACGRPVITTDHPGCRDAIIPNRSGILIPTKDTESLVVAINKLLNSKELCIKMGREAREYAEKKFNIKHVIEKHIEAYEKFFK